jgi:VWFA-related protein
MIIRRAVIASAAFVLLAALTASAQQPPAPPVFQTTTALVQVNVVALDKHGKPVADLKREEFEIRDNGVLQDVRFFAGQRENVAPRPPELSATNVFTNLIETSAGPQSGYTVIVIDNLYSGSDPSNEEGSLLARSRALEMLRSAPAGEKIAIYAPGTRFKVICEFTTDRDLLEKELRKFKVIPSTPASEPRPTLPSFLDPQGAAAAVQSRGAADMARAEGQVYSDTGDFQLSALADHVSGIPGRKKADLACQQIPHRAESA